MISIADMARIAALEELVKALAERVARLERRPAVDTNSQHVLQRCGPGRPRKTDAEEA